MTNPMTAMAYHKTKPPTDECILITTSTAQHRVAADSLRFASRAAAERER
jgi:hypothetical protein